MVSTAPTGSDFSGTFSPIEKSQGSQRFAAPAAADLEESRTEPPPTARIISTCSSMHSWAAFRAREIFGFASTPPSSTNWTPASFKEATIWS